jgi:hypothetical protein
LTLTLALAAALALALAPLALSSKANRFKDEKTKALPPCRAFSQNDIQFIF